MTSSENIILSETVIGFDARVLPAEAYTAWTPERIAVYLLRSDVKSVLSTDVLVWPPRIAAVKTDAPHRNPMLGIWLDLLALQNRLQREMAVERKDYWLIGLSLLQNTLDQRMQERWDQLLWPTVPESAGPDKEWELLGYDVSDMALLSGLSNCGYDPSDIVQQRERWKDSLNEYHLFTNVNDAAEFTKLTNDRVREHAPFFGYGLYLIRSSLSL